MNNHLINIVKEYWKAESEKNLDKLVNMLSTGVKIDAPGWTIRGKEKAKESYGAFMAQYRATIVKPFRFVERGDVIAVEWNGKYERDDGEVIQARGCHVFVIKNDLIESINGYFDPSVF